MAARRTAAIGKSLDTLFRVGALGSLSDGELLECMLSRRNSDCDPAFRALVERHGPMVLGLCRTIVKNPHDAEDAFQATFLVLVRKATSIRRRDNIGPWLHGVAARVARKARARTARRNQWERPLRDELPDRKDPNEGPGPNLILIHEEIARLPELLRAPLLLFCIEGMSYDAAARTLGVSEPTLRGRLHRARKRLARRLSGRRINVRGLGYALAPGRFPHPPVSSALVNSTVHIALQWSAITVLSSATVKVPNSIATLAQGVIRIMTFQTFKLPAAGLLVGTGLLGTVVLAQQRYGRDDDRGSSSHPIVTAAAAQVDEQRRPSDSETERLKRLVAEQAKAGERFEIDRRVRQVKDFVAALGDNPAQLDAKSRQIRGRLKQQLHFDEDTIDLDSLLKRIKQSTTDGQFPGIPIYVDPRGMEEAGIGLMQIVAVPRKGSVEFVLTQALRPIRLSHFVGDGFLMISSREDVNDRRLKDLDDKMDRVLRALDRLGSAR
jgi:RNA polymerase sigma factor (sigma-70 family)